ncbi:hypothetical protein ACR6C2_15460 [Streptomyces sp. INA 01156]
MRWLSCTASYGNQDGASSRPASEDTVATVDCDGETEDGKEITVTGKITHAVDGACVRGDITAKVDGKQWFRVDGLGDCDATSPPAVGEPTHRGPPQVLGSTRAGGPPPHRHRDGHHDRVVRAVPVLSPRRGQVIQTPVQADRACIG